MTDQLSEKFWSDARKNLQEILDVFSQNIDLDSAAFVQHYISHDEYEMAFEGLFLELIKRSVDLKDIDVDSYIELGKKLKLDQECLFDRDFWLKFNIYMNNN